MSEVEFYKVAVEVIVAAESAGRAGEIVEDYISEALDMQFISIEEYRNDDGRDAASNIADGS